MSITDERGLAAYLSELEAEIAPVPPVDRRAIPSTHRTPTSVAVEPPANRPRYKRLIALDIEAEFNLHVYGERLCLIQVFDGRRAVIIDPFNIPPDRLRELFEHESLGKLMYDASSDQTLLFKAYGFRITPLIDLRPAADLLELTKRDLGSVVELTLGHTVERKKRYQQYNWTRRPIERGALEYALSDVFHLFDLHARLSERLQERGLLEEFYRRSDAVQSREIDVDRQPRIFRSNEYRNLRAAERLRFDRAYELRDECARDLDVPPDWVLPKRELFLFARGRIALDHLSAPPRIRGARYDRFVQALGSDTSSTDATG